jgi:glyoxylase-like metal-dependent hydrolase (beta-lactamase superfamily II)
VQNTGKQPSVIFVTHGHADHFFMASWNSRFAGQLSQSPAVPTLTNSQ